VKTGDYNDTVADIIISKVWHMRCPVFPRWQRA